MVEITIPLMLDVIRTIGILVGIVYYITIMRNQKETRNLQLFMQLVHWRTEESSKRNLELLNMEWKDYDDFERKYGSDNNPDNFGKRTNSWHQFNTMGVLLRKGLIDADTLFSFQTGETVLFHWTKFEGIIKEIRRRYNMPRFQIDFEYLANENRRWLENKGYTVEVPETYYHYIPDEK